MKRTLTVLACTLSLACTLCLASSGRASSPAQRTGTQKPDEYGDICWKREKEILRNFAIQLKNEPETTGYIITYGARRVPSLEVALERGERAKKYLSKLGLPDERVVAIDGGFRENLTWELWFVPAGATPPYPTPTVDRGEVEIVPRAGENPCPPGKP